MFAIKIYYKKNIIMTNNQILVAFFISVFFSFAIKVEAQTTDNDSLKLNYNKIFAYCLDANVKPVFSLIEFDGTKKISAKDEKFISEFKNRFMYPEDRSSYLMDKKSDIDKLLEVFHSYWRQSLLDTSKNYDTVLIANLKEFLNKNYPPARGFIIKEDSIDVYVKKYVESKGFHTTDGIGKTGPLYDLLVWRNEKDTTYSFRFDKETISARVIMMENFITLGWEEFATLGRAYPGGWTTKEALYCVEKAYDLNSEDFLVSYLAHESRHFSDYKLFPKLKSADLEFRAKLTELSLAKKTLYKLIEFFIANANYESESGHQVADYCVIRDLSKELFKTNFEKDIKKWEMIKTGIINKAAYKILKANTEAMQQIGPHIEKYIKN